MAVLLRNFGSSSSRLWGRFRRSRRFTLIAIFLFSVVSMFWMFCLMWSRDSRSASRYHPKRDPTEDTRLNITLAYKLYTDYISEKLDINKKVLPDADGVMPFRVLFVCDAEILNKSALPYSRWFIHLYKAMTRLPGVEADIWGPGFSGYDGQKTLARNIKRRWGSAGYFDFAFNYTTRYTSTRKWSTPGIGGPPIAVLFKDCVMYEKLPSDNYSEIFPCVHEGADLYFHRSANNMGYYAYKGYGNLLWHLPPAVHKAIFTKDSYLPHKRRPIDIFVPGCNKGNNSLYDRLEELVSLGAITGNIYISDRRGEEEDDGNGDDNHQKRFYDKDEDECITDVEKDYKNYLFKLKRSKIVVVSAGARGSDLRRYIEAAAAGALVIADVPREHEEEVRAFSRIVYPDDPEAMIVKTLNFWLTNSKARERVARLGQRYVLSRYTVENSAVEVVRAMQSFLYGQRGLHFGHKFEDEDHFLPAYSECMD